MDIAALFLPHNMFALCTACETADDCGTNEFCDVDMCKCLTGYSAQSGDCIGIYLHGYVHCL